MRLFRIANIAIVALLVLGMGCNMMDYHPYDVESVDVPRINQVNVKKIEQSCAGKTSLTIAVTGDTQGWYDDTRDFVKDVNSRSGIDFVVHLGDLTDYGSAREFEWQRELLDKLNVPYVCNIGNHDCLGTGISSFRYIFGDTDFSFIAGRVKFLFINTNALEVNFPGYIPDLNFIESQYTGDFDQTIVTMHAKPYTEVFDNNLAEAFQNRIEQLPGILCCLAGHGHSIEHDDLFGDGIMYHQTPCIEKRTYFILHITPEGYSYEEITF